MGRLALTTLAHVAVFIGVDLLFAYVIVVPGDTDGIGTGLLAFATMAMLAMTWGCLDGWFLSPTRVAVLWLITGAVTGVEMALVIQLPPGGSDYAVLRDDLISFVPFALGLIAIPGLIAGILVSTLRPARTPAR